MAKGSNAPPRKSLVSRAGAAARKVVKGSKTPVEKSPAPVKSVSGKSTATAAKKAAPVKAAAKKTPQKKAAAKKAPAKKAAPVKAAAKKAPAKKTAAKKAPAKKAPPKKTAAERTAAKKTAAKKTAAKQTSPKRGAPAGLAVLEQEKPWTKSELARVRTQLEEDVVRLADELAVAEEDLADMIADSNDGAGNDQADVGSASFERDQEIVVVNNAREVLVQSRRALERIDEGSYGQCESCGNPIGKNRLMVFPRATLCLSCKQREERR